MAGGILILGSGSCAFQMADDLIRQGSKVILATRSSGFLSHPPHRPATGSLELLTQTLVAGCRAHQGNFQIRLEKNGGDIARTVGAVIIAEEWAREANFSWYDLQPSSAVVSLSAYREMVSDGNENELRGKRVAFLTGLANESNPVIMRDVLETALRLQSTFESQTYILAGNLKIAGSGLERLLWEVRKAGSVIFKFDHLLPDIQQDPNGAAVLRCHDQAAGIPFTLRPDVTVVDESVKPSEYLAALSRVFRLHTNADGFIQTENPHRLSVFTNRSGILAVGPSRRIQSLAQQQQDAAAAVIAVRSIGTETPVEKAEINPNECVRCLTCYRICPHRAITFSEKVMVEQNRCEGCGICAAECPREAVQIRGLRRSDILNGISGRSIARDSEPNAPTIVVFACKHSAVLASETAASMGALLPENIRMIPVPCAGSISMDHMLSTFLNSVDGVFILTCRDGNCHSEFGNRYTHLRVRQLEDLFTKIGFQKERIKIKTIAANMAVEFIETVKCFERSISELGAG